MWEATKAMRPFEPSQASSGPSSTLRLRIAGKFVPLLQPARYKGLHGGRGSGKSHVFAELLVATCLRKPTRAVCVREVQKSLEQSVKLLIEDKIRQMGVESSFRILNTHIEGPGGGRIIFQGMQNHTAESIKSLEGYNVAWCEEAQSISQRSLDLLRPTIRTEGSELWFSWNPNKPTDPVDALLRGGSPPSGAIVIEANYMDNPWFPDELRGDMEDDRARDPEKFAHVWGGDYSLNSTARVFRNWIVREFETPADAIHRFGADWGFANDPTALVRCHIDGRKLYVDQEAVEVGCEIDETPYLFSGDKKPEGWPKIEAFQNGPSKDLPKRKRRAGIVGADKWLIRADSARPETVSYMKRHGYRIISALKGQGSLEDGVEFLRSFDIIVHPRCVNVINELKLYSYKIDPQTEEILPLLDDKNNHTIDALRYALEELRRTGWKPRDEAKDKPRDRWDKAFGEKMEDTWRVK
jgi:phage terminase large subunit